MASWKPDVDITSGVPIPHLTFILNHFLPSYNFNIGDVIELGETISKHYSMAKDFDTWEKFASGSLMEGLAIPEYIHRETSERVLADVDVMGIDKTCQVYQESADFLRHVSVHPDPLLMDGSGCKEGFVRLRKPSGDWYTIQDILDEIFKISNSLDYSGGSVSYHGPAISQNDRKYSEDTNIPKLYAFYRNDAFSIDDVYALRFDKWPKQAEEWRTRHRPSGWPSRKFIARVISNGCHLVQVRYPGSSHPDEDWRLSFSAVEQALVRTLSSVQRKCYVLLKIAVSSALAVFKPDKILSSYHLKTVLLWTCESIPQSEFTECTVGVRYLDLLDKLITFLREDNLPNYFVRGNNMLSHITWLDLEIALKVVQEIRRDPVRAFLVFNKEYKFVFTIENFEMTEYLDLIVENIELISSGKEGEVPITLFMDVHCLILKLYIREGMFIEAADCLKQMVDSRLFMFDIRALLEQHQNRPCLLHFPANMFLRFCLLTLPKSDTRQVLFTRHSQGCFLSALARYFLKEMHRVSTMLDQDNQVLLQTYIFQAFRNVIVNLKGSAMDILDLSSWSIFYCPNFGDQIIPEFDALQFLENCLSGQLCHLTFAVKSAEKCVRYDTEDEYLVHDPLMRMELEGAGHIRVLIAIYVHYLIVVRAIKCHGKASSEAQKALAKMTTVFFNCIQCEHVQEFCVFGYVWMYKGDFAAAALSFHVAMVLGNNCSDHTYRNKWLCLGVAIYETWLKAQGIRTPLRDVRYTEHVTEYFWLVLAVLQYRHKRYLVWRKQ